MKYFLPFLLFSGLNTSAWASNNPCGNWPSWFKPVCEEFQSIWTQGDNELYLSGYAWHNRYTYSPAKIQSFNENAWGGGFGKGLYDAKGNWHGLYAVAFMDSHDHVEPLLGYAWYKYFPVSNNTKIGLGLSAFITSRVDIYHNIPFPGILPVLTVTHKRVSLSASYIPGSKGAGNVLFIMGKYTFKNS